MTYNLCFNAPEIQQASQRLSTAVRQCAEDTAAELGFRWRPAALAPTTLEDLTREFKACHLSGLAMRVSYAHSTVTVFDGSATNWANRFWHDSRHVWLGADFDVDGELEVASCQLQRLRMLGIRRESLEYRLMFSDTVGQTLYLQRAGRFVRDQQRFGLRCLNMPVDEAIEAEWVSELLEDAA